MKPQAIAFIIGAGFVFAGLVWFGFRVSEGHKPSGRVTGPTDGDGGDYHGPIGH